MAFENDELNMRRAQRREAQRSLVRRQRFLKIGLVVLAAVLLLGGGALLITSGAFHGSEPTEPGMSTNPPTQTQPSVTEPPVTVPDTVACTGEENLSPSRAISCPT